MLGPEFGYITYSSAFIIFQKSVEKLLSLAIDSFNSMMKEISAKEASPAGLHSIIKVS